MSGFSRQHDRELLDALEACPSEAFSGETWRVTAKGRDALRGSTAGGRWSPPGEFEVLYTSLARTGALDEIGYRLSLEPVWPSRLEHELHRLMARTNNSLRFADISSLSKLGVDIRRYASFDYSVTQAIAAAAFFLDFDGLIVPSARSTALNLVIFRRELDVGERLKVEASEPVDWSAWRSQYRKRTPPSSYSCESALKRTAAKPRHWVVSKSDLRCHLIAVPTPAPDTAVAWIGDIGRRPATREGLVNV